MKMLLTILLVLVIAFAFPNIAKADNPCPPVDATCSNPQPIPPETCEAQGGCPELQWCGNAICPDEHPAPPPEIQHTRPHHSMKVEIISLSNSLKKSIKLNYIYIHIPI